MRVLLFLQLFALFESVKTLWNISKFRLLYVKKFNQMSFSQLMLVLVLRQDNDINIDICCHGYGQSSPPVVCHLL